VDRDPEAPVDEVQFLQSLVEKARRGKPNLGTKMVAAVAGLGAVGVSIALGLGGMFLIWYLILRLLLGAY
jgi:hypothetical protein